MILTVQRVQIYPTSLLGILSIEGRVGRFSFTLEPRADRPEHPAIPAGTYALTLGETYNARLWSPDGRLLPRLGNVPNRTGIVMHAGNNANDTLGCILVARDHGVDYVSQSRAALIDLVKLLKGAQGPHQIIVKDIDPADHDPLTGT